MEIYTLVHVIISLIAIAAGGVVLVAMLGGKRSDTWNWLFLVTTVATSVTGFGFLFFKLTGVTPGLVIGALSLVVLAIAIYAYYPGKLAGAWRWGYVLTAMIAFYFNVFVLVTQSFLKIPPLRALMPGPDPSGPAFGVSQLVVLAAFAVLTFLAIKRFHPVGAVSA